MKDIIDFMNMISKIKYDIIYKRMNFRKDNKVFIILYKGYNLFGGLKKIIKLWYSLFEIIKYIKILVYYLKLLLIWNIHNIINIVILKSGLKGKNFYNKNNNKL